MFYGQLFIVKEELKIKAFTALCYWHSYLILLYLIIEVTEQRNVQQVKQKETDRRLNVQEKTKDKITRLRLKVEKLNRTNKKLKAKNLLLKVELQKKKTKSDTFISDWSLSSSEYKREVNQIIHSFHVL